MNKKIIFLIILILCRCHAFSQQIQLPPVLSNPQNKPPPLKNPNYQYFPSQVIDPKTGDVFKNKYPDIEGFAFFTEDWNYSLIKLTNEKAFDMIETKLNVYTNELYFKTDKNAAMVFVAGYVKELDIYDSIETKNIIYRFKTGFPKIDNQNENSFYEVITEGNVTLLKFIKKIISVKKNDISGEVDKQFETYEDYYVFSNNEMKRLKKDKDFISRLLSERKDEVESFLKKNPLNSKNVNDIIKLFQFYNSLAH